MKKYTIKSCPKNICGIYKIDFPNGKSYIGKAVDIKERIKEHNTDTKQELLYLAVTKYYKNYIPEFYILEETSRELLNEKEKYYIALYQTYTDKSKGYNLTPGGDGAALGIDNIASKFTQEDIETIINLLQNTSISMANIAKEYGCSRATIERLNSGNTYYNPKLIYPIRQNSQIVKTSYNNGNSALNEGQLKSLYYDLQFTQIPMNELATKYNIAKTTLSNINNGRTYIDNKQKYPIRKKNSQHKRHFTLEELLQIKELLQQDKSKMTMDQIGKILKCDRKVIADINKGKRQPQEGWNYPIRK